MAGREQRHGERRAALGDAAAVVGIGLREVPEHALLDVLAALRQRADEVRHQLLALPLELDRAELGDAVEVTDNYGIWWSYVPHFIQVPVYVYAYSFGYLFSLAIYRRYVEEGESPWEAARKGTAVDADRQVEYRDVVRTLARSGIDLIKRLKIEKPKLKLLVLSMHGEHQYAARALGCVEAWVLTDYDNLPARRLYAAVGGVEREQATLLYSFPLARDAPPVTPRPRG